MLENDISYTRGQNFHLGTSLILNAYWEWPARNRISSMGISAPYSGRNLIPALVNWTSASAWLYKHPWVTCQNMPNILNVRIVVLGWLKHLVGKLVWTALSQRPKFAFRIYKKKDGRYGVFRLFQQLMLVSHIHILRCDKVRITKVVVFHVLSWFLAVVRSESQVFVGNAANLKKGFTCKTFGCDKNSVVGKYFWRTLAYIVEHCRTLLNIVS